MIKSGEIFDDSTYKHMILNVLSDLRELDLLEANACKPSYLGDVDVREHMLSSAITFKKGSYFCINDDFEVLAVGGIAKSHDGVANAWLWSTQSFDSHKIELVRFIKKRIPEFLKNEGHRIQCLSAGFHSNAIEWLQSCGFKKEGELIKFGSNGETFYQFGITR